MYAEESGNSSEGRKEGAWYQYEPDGETISVKVTYKRGKKVGWIDYPNAG
jgi:hypothetical protein